MLIALSLLVLLLVSVTIGALGVALFIAGYGLGWITAS